MNSMNRNSGLNPFPGFAAPASQTGEYQKLATHLGTTPRESHVQDEMKSLYTSVECMERELSGLIERLHSVLPQDSQAAAAGGAPPDAYRVPLAADIRALRNRVDAMASNVRRVVAEVEL